MPGTQPPEGDTREGRDWVNWPPYQNTGGLASAGLSTRSVEGRAAQPASALLFCSLNTPSPRYLSEHTKHLAHLSSPLGTSISWVPVQGQGGEGAGNSKPPRPTRCGRTSTSHPSAGDCHPNNWSLRTARSGLHPRSGSDTAPKWGRFQPPLLPALRPPILNNTTETAVRSSVEA